MTPPEQTKRANHRLAILAVAAAALTLSACAAQQISKDNQITISLLGTNDVHGQLLPDGDRGGLVAISAYVDALRAARAQDHGAVLVIDAGDMWQGTLESNLVEGAAVVDAYNAIGFDAAAIGNHEFDFGPVGSKAIPEDAQDDPRGALKLGARTANFPLLAANLIDDTTGKPVDWDNVRPSTTLDIKGVTIGIIGVMTANALQATIAANTAGLSVAPLAETIIREATALRNKGASIVIVTAHAGSACRQFDDPHDSSSCNMEGEIMQVAEAIPRGLVDHIFAGHAHQGIAHIVNGISITSAYSNTRAFSRVDFRFDRTKGHIVSREVHPPHWACLSLLPSTGACASTVADPGETVRATYEGREIKPSKEIIEIAERAAEQVAAVKQERLGVSLESAFLHPPATESALANLVTQAMREATDADISVDVVVGGLRKSLPAGELTYGAIYEMSPFDNRIVMLELTGAELKTIIAGQAHRGSRRVGFSGMRVFLTCENDAMDIVIRLPNDSTVQDEDTLTVVVTDFVALGGEGVLKPITPPGGFDIDYRKPLARDLLVDWLRDRGGSLHPDDFLTTESPKWNVSDNLKASCTL